VRQDGNELGIDYQRAIKFFDPNTLVDALGGVEKVIQLLGEDRVVNGVVKAFGLERLLNAADPEQVVNALGPDRVMNVLGREKLLQRLLATLTPEERERLLRPSDNPDPPTS
jgi:hypothetical protein